MTEKQSPTSAHLDMPEWVGLFENIANKLFISSFVLNKIKDLPIGWYSSFFSQTAMFAVAFAYSIQVFTTSYYQVSAEVESQFNYKHFCQMIASIGTINSWICISLPHLWLWCLWIFCMNNALWIYNEQTRLETPSIFPAPPPNQKEFCSYVNYISMAPLCSAISNTLALFSSYADQVKLIGILLNWTVSYIGLLSFYQCTTPEISDISASICPS